MERDAISEIGIDDKGRLYVSQWATGSVRPGKVEYSSGCESRPSKVGQPLGSELWADGSDPKG